jgi:hypothetical protein
MAQRRRRADWFRNELEERPLWWLLLGVLMMLVLALTEHFGWGTRPVTV